MKMHAVMTRGTLLGVLALALVACSSSRDKPPEMNVLNNGQCMSMADTLKTLRKGDPLPRVVQVMGQPARSYRVVAPFSTTYDVVEYDLGESACARLVLNSPNKKLQMIFDEKGGYIGSGRGLFRRLQAATIVRVTGIPVDVRQYDAQ